MIRYVAIFMVLLAHNWSVVTISQAAHSPVTVKLILSEEAMNAANRIKSQTSLNRYRDLATVTDEVFQSRKKAHQEIPPTKAVEKNQIIDLLGPPDYESDAEIAYNHEHGSFLFRIHGLKVESLITSINYTDLPKESRIKRLFRWLLRF